MSVDDIEISGEPIARWEERLKIDPDALDHEIEMQPYLFYQVASAYAEALSARDEAYDEIKRCDAELNFTVRDTLANDGYRVTEEMVKSAVQSHGDHGAAQDVFLQRKRRADELEALKSAFQQRGYVLRDLAQLFITGYTTSSSAGGGVPDYIRDRAVEEKNRARLRGGLQGGGRRRREGADQDG